MDALTPSLKELVKRRLPVELIRPEAFVPRDDAPPFVSVSMQRSGQHAVLHWICSQMESAAHFNYCTAARQSWHLRVFPKTGRVLFYYDYGSTVRDTGKQDQDQLAASLRASGAVRHLLYSFENRDIEDHLFERIDRRYHPTFLLIVRDPYNWLASTFAHTLYEPASLQQRLCLWKKQVAQSLSLEQYLPGRVVSVDFGRWFSERAYREHLCTQLGLDLRNDGSRLTVPQFGGGSSFKGTAYDGRAHEMTVMDRWQRFAEDPAYRACFEDEELVRLAEQYFQMERPF